MTTSALQAVVGKGPKAVAIVKMLKLGGSATLLNAFGVLSHTIATRGVATAKITTPSKSTNNHQGRIALKLAGELHERHGL